MQHMQQDPAYIKYDTTSQEIPPLTIGRLGVSWASTKPPRKVVEPIKCGLAYYLQEPTLLYACGSYFHTNQGEALLKDLLRDWMLAQQAQQPRQWDCEAVVQQVTPNGSMSYVWCDWGNYDPNGAPYMEHEWAGTGLEHIAAKAEWQDIPVNDSNFLVYALASSQFSTHTYAFGAYDVNILVEGALTKLESYQWQELVDASAIFLAPVNWRNGSAAKIFLEVAKRMFPVELYHRPFQPTMLTVIACYR